MIVVAPVSATAARYAVTRWHYSRRMPVGAGQAFGVWEHDRYIGVVLIGRGAARFLGRQLDLGPFECVELTRVALRAHDAPVSQIVTRAIAALRISSPGLRAVVSFADPYHGHHGGIYQAMNWLYLGETKPSRRYVSRTTGELLHPRVVAQSGVVRQFGRVTAARARPDETDLVIVPGKHRYVLPLDRGMRRRLTPYASAYPPAGEVSTATR